METGCTFKVLAEIPAIDHAEDTVEKARLMTMGTMVTISTMGIPRIQAREEGLIADIRFGDLTGGEHRMIGDHGDLLLMELNDKIVNCTGKGYIIIEFQVKGTARYKVGVKALGDTIDRLYQRIATLASEKRWAKTPQPDSLLGNLAKSTDEQFLSLYCLISGLSPKYMVDGKLTSTGISKIKYAVKGGIDGKDVGPSNDDVVALTDGRKNPIRPKSMGWGRTEYDRLTFLIQLEHDTSGDITYEIDSNIQQGVCVHGSRTKIQRDWGRVADQNVP
jgi:hypothetical protein